MINVWCIFWKASSLRPERPEVHNKTVVGVTIGHLFWGIQILWISWIFGLPQKFFYWKLAEIILWQTKETRGGHFHKACRTICDRDQHIWLMKVCLDLLIALKKCPWLVDILARNLTNVFCLTLLFYWVAWSLLWSIFWSLELV